MNIADMHCDTISEIFNHCEMGEDCNLKKNNLHLDLEKLQKGNYILQNFAAFINLGKQDSPFERCMELIDCFYTEVNSCREYVGVVKSYKDIVENQESGKISAMLTIEEGGVCLGNLRLLRNFYRLGVRMMTLTWNYQNELAFPNFARDQGGKGKAVAEKKRGLTQTGFEFIEEMEHLGMIIDVSHLSDAGFWDVYNHTKKPFAASHSNARAVCSHPRNLTDPMIRALSERGGVLGLNYFANFLRDFPEGEPAMSMANDIVRHAVHIVNTGGIYCLGLGSDFDGIDHNLEIQNGGQMELLAESLKKGGFHESQIEAIFNKNVLRLYKDTL